MFLNVTLSRFIKAVGTHFEFKCLLRGIYLTIENNIVNDIGVLYDRNLI